MRAAIAIVTIGLALPALAAEPKPCDVLMLADITAALGADWKRNEAFSEGEYCSYRGAPKAAVTIILTSDPSGAEAILAGRQKLAGAKAKPAPGPGKGAYRVTSPIAIAIVFGKGDYVGQIEATPAATKDFALLDKLAAAAYARLP
jgi:hypothetical protein